MLTLYVAKGACSIAAHILLKELDLPHTIEMITFGGEKHALLKKLNCLGQVPTLVLPTGEVITQNTAILSFLGDIKPEANLFAPVGTLARARIIEWIAFLSSTVHPRFTAFFSPLDFVADQAAVALLQDKATQKLLMYFALVEKELQGKTWAMGDNYSIVDPYLAYFFRVGERMKLPMAQFTAYNLLVEQVFARPASKAALALENTLASHQ